MSQPHERAPAATPETQPRGLSRGLVRLGVVLTGAILLAGGGLWFFLTPGRTPAVDRLQQALQHLKNHETAAAREIALELQAANFTDEQFPGAVDFILGIASFEDAEHSQEPELAAPLYAAAVSSLQEAEHLGLPDTHRPAWAFALGKCLFHTDDFAAAQPLLEESVQSADSKHVAAMLLATIYLDPEDRTPERLQRGFELVDGMLRKLDAETSEARAAQLLKAELQIELGQHDEAQAIAEALKPSPDHAVSATVLLAQLRLAQNRIDEALSLLMPLVGKDNLAEHDARRAGFLAAWAAERKAGQLTSATANDLPPRGNPEEPELCQRAQDFYQKVTDRFERSEEGLAAFVHSGRLQQKSGAHEKAIKSFGAALRMVHDTQRYHNRWLSIEDFRLSILEAWNAWNQAGRFGEAIALAQMMSPLFPRVQADELAARTRQRWAENLAEELQRGTATVRAQRTPELRRLWCESGSAFARLADARGSSFERAGALWTSVDHYFRGHDFQTALREINELLSDPPESLRPVALVRRGEIELDLDQIDDALRDFTEVIRTTPTSPSAFTAHYLIGVCHLEKDDPAAAEKAWGGLLSSSTLTPAASEWRDALFATAKLHCELAGLEHRKAQRRETAPAEITAAWSKLQELATSSSRMFEEYISRYPNAAEFSEAQYYLGKALELQAEWQQHQWTLAETDNARQQSRRQRDVILQRALLQFEQLRDRLSTLSKEDRLDPAQVALLTNVWFDYPTICFHLGRYEDAIGAYSAAANRHPHDVRVLTAYLQMAQAYSLSGKPIEARSMLEQAQVILDQRQIPDAAFEAPTTSLTRSEWNEWLDRARQVQR